MPADLKDIIASFEELAPADRLEWLIEFGNRLPPLSKIHHADRDAGRYIVHECQAPVFLKVEVHAGKLAVYADVPREAPIARGFVAILKSVFDGSPISDFADAPVDLLESLQIRVLLGMQRQVGLSAIYDVLKAAV